jgi:hypothetical protein
MAQYANQHFVPQFYFRRFNGGTNAINLVLLGTGRVIFDASVKHQCAGNMFYGVKELEKVFTEIEGAHSNALRAVADASWKQDWSVFTQDVYGSLLEAVLFQRSRTALEIEKSKDVPNAMAMPGFRHHIANTPGIEHREQILEAIDKGEIRITQTSEAAVLESIDVAMGAVNLISDLEFCVLRNRTDYPFVFGDSPVVFYNTLLRNVVSRGVLGLQSPGLQIFYPLDSVTALMFYDENAYQLARVDSIDVTERSDVSQINALQFKHSLNAVYFGCADSREYVADLWGAYGRKTSRAVVETRQLSNVELGGTLHEGTMTLMLERHLDIRLDLSFIKCTPLPDSGKFPGRRSDALVAEHKKRTETLQGGERNGGN